MNFKVEKAVFDSGVKIIFAVIVSTQDFC